MALIISTALLLTVPLAGGPRPAPAMDPVEVRTIVGTSEITREAEVDGTRRRVLRIDAADTRINGTAEQILHVEGAPAAGLERSTGVMRLKNEYGRPDTDRREKRPAAGSRQSSGPTGGRGWGGGGAPA